MMAPLPGPEPIGSAPRATGAVTEWLTEWPPPRIRPEKAPIPVADALRSTAVLGDKVPYPWHVFLSNCLVDT